jgi:hydroxyacylglutathione hydrolase
MVKSTALQVWPIPAFSDNYIWCIHDGQSALIVDPGDAGPVIHFLQENRLQLMGILITHYHADHIGGIAALLNATANGASLPVYGPAAEPIAGLTQALMQGDEVEIAAPAIHLQVLEVPGHTLGHIAYFAPAKRAEEQIANKPSVEEPPRLFCGDTLFASGCGRLFEGTPTQMHASLAKFAALPSNTLVYCTHEYTLSNIRFALAVEPNNPDLIAWAKRAEALRELNLPTLPTTIDQEIKTNPFMRCDQAVVRQVAQQVAGQPQLSGASEVLAAIRAWKDRF